MSRDEILSRLISILSEQLSVDKETITESSLLATDLGADSLDTAEIAMTIQEEFGYDFKDHEIQAVKTVGDIVNILSMKAMKNQ